MPHQILSANEYAKSPQGTNSGRKIVYRRPETLDGKTDSKRPCFYI